MKSLSKLFLFLFIISVLPSAVFSQNLFNDDFQYPVRDSLEGIGGWYRSGVNSPYNVSIITPGLIYAGYQGSGIGNTPFMSNQEGDICFHNFTVQSTGNVYLSFMIKIDSFTTNATQGYNTGFNLGTGATFLNTKPYIKKITSNTFNFGIMKSDSAAVYSSTVYSTGLTYLVVVKYTFVTGGATNDSAKMYVFSSAVPATEPSVPTVFQTVGTDIENIASVFLSNSYAQTGLKNSPVKIDGIRVGKSWSTSVLNSVRLISSEIPDQYILKQNYPNPFNPKTIINYQLPEFSFVLIKVYDIAGNEVSTLVNEKQRAGSYETEFDGSNLSSGVYFYRLTTKAGSSSEISGNNSGKEFSETMKMFLVK